MNPLLIKLIIVASVSTVAVFWPDIKKLTKEKTDGKSKETDSVKTGTASGKRDEEKTEKELSKELVQQSLETIDENKIESKKKIRKKDPETGQFIKE